MKDRVERLRVVLKNHHMQINPANISLEPPLIRTVKKKETSEAEQSYTLTLIKLIILSYM